MTTPGVEAIMIVVVVENLLNEMPRK